MTVTFSPGTVLKQTGQIQLQVPYYYTTADGSESTEAVLVSMPTGSSTDFTINSFTYSQSTKTVSITYTRSSSADLTSSSSVSFSVTNFRNPLSASPKPGFYLSTFDDDGF